MREQLCTYQHVRRRTRTGLRDGYILRADIDSVRSCFYYIKDYQGNNRMVVNAEDGKILQVSSYYAYGNTISDISSDQYEHAFKYGGKELYSRGCLDLYDFEARQYDAIVPMFTSIDPLAEKYYGISPYVYCAGDPVNCVDMHGDSLTIVGDKASDATAQLQNVAGSSISLKRDSETGEISYQKNKKRLHGKAKRIAKIIDDKDVNVSVTAQSSPWISKSNNQWSVGGSFMGNVYNKGKVSAHQVVIPSVLEQIDICSGSDIGKTMLHEVTEAYEGGLISLQKEKSSPAQGPESVYDEAHKSATPQPVVESTIVLNMQKNFYVKGHLIMRYT